MAINWSVIKKSWYSTDAWRAAQEPDAIAEAIKFGEQITELLTQAASLIDRACQDMDSIIENTTPRCRIILDQLTDEADRLTSALTRLRAAHKAVKP